jgi:hypothetical protein
VNLGIHYGNSESAHAPGDWKSQLVECKRKLEAEVRNEAAAFVLASTEHGTMIVNRNDWHQLPNGGIYGVGYHLLVTRKLRRSMKLPTSNHS